MSDKKYTVEQFKACADLCGIQMETVRKHAREYALDVADPVTFKKQHGALMRRSSTAKDSDHQKAIKSKAVTEAEIRKVTLEKAKFDLAVSKGEYISIEDNAALYAHLGLLTKTHLEAMGGPIGIKGEGKSAKEITKIVDAAAAEILHQLSTLGN